MRVARRQQPRRRRGVESLPAGADQVDAPVERVAIDHDLDDVAVASLPIGPPASASGPTWPMQAPVDTPEKRASVTTATRLAPRDDTSAPT